MRFSKIRQNVVLSSDYVMLRQDMVSFVSTTCDSSSCQTSSKTWSENSGDNLFPYVKFFYFWTVHNFTWYQQLKFWLCKLGNSIGYSREHAYLFLSIFCVHPLRRLLLWHFLATFPLWSRSYTSNALLYAAFPFCRVRFVISPFPTISQMEYVVSIPWCTLPPMF